MPGKLIAIEGCDGSGKHTQASMLLERLKKEGKEAVLFSFPRYETFFGVLVRKYLSGEFGSLGEVRPEFASLLYSLDRYNALPEIEESLWNGKVVVCDRYTASNLAHQAAKLSGKERERFIRWMGSVESRLPRPSLTVFLDLPVSVSERLMRDRQKDIHESNAGYLEATRRVYLELCRKQKWARVECGSGSGIKPRQEIHEMVWERVSGLL